MSGATLTISVIILSIGLLVGGIFLASKTTPTATVAASSAAKATIIGHADYQWGNLALKSSPQKADYQIKNEGTDILKLFNAQTSCECTTAQLILDRAASPLYRMHNKFDYILSVPPGQTATLEAVFDPGFHGPAGVGHIERQITVQTNDPKNPTLTFTASADVSE